MYARKHVKYDAINIIHQYPSFELEDKLVLKEGSVDKPLQVYFRKRLKNKTEKQSKAGKTKNDLLSKDADRDAELVDMMMNERDNATRLDISKDPMKIRTAATVTWDHNELACTAKITGYTAESYLFGLKDRLEAYHHHSKSRLLCSPSHASSTSSSHISFGGPGDPVSSSHATIPLVAPTVLKASSSPFSHTTCTRP